MCVWGWICKNVDGMHHQSVISGLGEPPTALTGLDELLTGLSLILNRHRKGEETMESQLVITPWRVMLLPLSISSGDPLKMPHRELVVIRTHDSLITPLRSSRNTVTRSGRSRGRVVLSEWADRQEVYMQDGQHGLSLGHKLGAVKHRMCIVGLVASPVILLKQLFITVFGRDEQTHAKEDHDSAGFHYSQTH